MKRSISEDGINKELECAICGCVMIDPRVLHCQHAFCMRCIFNLIKRDRSRNPCIKCPFGCPELTRITSGDVRTLKRNPVIGSLCSVVRKRAAPSEVSSCDFCGADNVPCTMCGKCTGMICKNCGEEDVAFSDHGFLCLEADKRNRSPDEGAADGKVGSSCESKTFPVLITARTAAACVKQHLESQLDTLSGNPNNTVVVDLPTCDYLVHYLQNCQCRGVTQEGIDAEFQYQALIPPAQFRSRAAQPRSEGERMWDSKELSILATCNFFAERAAEVIRSCHENVDRVRKAIVISCTATDVEVAACLAVLFRQVFDVTHFVIQPLLRRLSLLANFCGHKFVERLCQLFAGAAASQTKKTLTRRIRAHLDLGNSLIVGLNNNIIAVDAALVQHLEKLSLLERTIDDQWERSLKLSTTAIPDGSVRSRMSTLMNLPQLMQDQWNIISEAVKLVRDGLKLVEEELPEATRGISIGHSDRETIISLEKAFQQEVAKFFGLCGSIQHLQVLWLQCVIVLGKRFEREQLHSFLCSRRGRYALHAPVTLALLDTNVAEASKLVSTIAPQVTSIRQQHVVLLQRNPTSMSNLLALQGQLCNLTVQVLDLYQKEHFIKLREVNTSVTEFLLSMASLLAESFATYDPESVPKIFGDAQFSAEFSEPNATVSAVLSNLGSLLNERCSVIPKESECLLEQARSMGRCAALLLNADLLQQNRTTTTVTQPEGKPVDHLNGTGEEAEETYNDSCKDFALARATQLFTADVPKLVARHLTVDLGSIQKILLPYHHGFYWLPQRCPDRIFEYFVEAQTGELIIEAIPETRLEKAFSVIARVVGSTTWFVVVNVAVAIGAAMVDKHLHLPSSTL